VQLGQNFSKKEIPKWSDLAGGRGGRPTPGLEQFQGKLCFQGKHNLLKNPECKTYIQYSEKFQGKLCFQGKRKLLKILNVKSIFNTVKNFRATLFFQGKRKLLKNREWLKNFQYNAYSLGGDLCNLD